MSFTVFVTWNGTTVDGPELIYHDELLLTTNDTITDVDGPGRLVCRSALSSTLTWHLTDSRPVLVEGMGMFRQTRQTGSPSLSRLSTTLSALRTEPLTNGLWFCDSDVESTRVYVGLFARAPSKLNQNCITDNWC